MKLRLQKVVLAGAFFACLFAAAPSSAEAQICRSWTFGTWSPWVTSTGSFNSNYLTCSRSMPTAPYTFFSARVWQENFTSGAGWRKGSARRETLFGACALPPYPSYLILGVISQTVNFSNGLFDTVHKTTSSNPGCLSTLSINVTGSTYIYQTHCAIGTCSF